MSVRFRQLLEQGETVRVMATGRLLSPVTFDLLALAGGYHGCWLDQEHVGLTWREILDATTACRASGLDNFVRMAPTNYAQVTQALEAGAGGVMAAQIHSAEHAEEFVRWSKFMPRGMRGLNVGGFDADYTYLKPREFAERANREHLVLIQIETLGALEQAEAIAAIDGVDMLFVGPFDMSQMLGVIGEMDHPKLWEAYGHVAQACAKHGKHWGTVCASPSAADRVHELGCRMLSLGSDVYSMRFGIDAIKQRYGSRF